MAYYRLDKINLDKRISWYYYDEITEEYLVFDKEVDRIYERFADELKIETSDKI